MEKKYQLKGTHAKEKMRKSADGTQNSEHILDIIADSKVLFSNIQDNFDIAVTIFKMNKKENDEDILDALQLDCERMAELEAEAGEIMQAMEKFEGSLQEINQANLEIVFEKLKKFEEESKIILERLIKG